MQRIRQQAALLRAKKEKATVMKTCETCKGTGQVEEPIQVGDIVEITLKHNPQWAGLGVVRDVSPYGRVALFTGNFKGQQGYFDLNPSMRRHGYIRLANTAGEAKGF